MYPFHGSLVAETGDRGRFARSLAGSPDRCYAGPRASPAGRRCDASDRLFKAAANVVIASLCRPGRSPYAPAQILGAASDTPPGSLRLKLDPAIIGSSSPPDEWNDARAHPDGACLASCGQFFGVREIAKQDASAPFERASLRQLGMRCFLSSGERHRVFAQYGARRKWIAASDLRAPARKRSSPIRMRYQRTVALDSESRCDRNVIAANSRPKRQCAPPPLALAICCDRMAERPT